MNDTLQLEDVTERPDKAIFIGPQASEFMDLILRLVNSDQWDADELFELRDEAKRIYNVMDLIVIDKYRLY